MIQRIQTVYLFFAFIATLLVLFFPLFSFSMGSTGADYFGDITFYAYNVISTPVEEFFTYSLVFYLPILIIIALIVIIIVWSIFLYKKRLIQMRLVNFSILLNIVMVVVLFLFYYDKLFEHALTYLQNEGVQVEVVKSFDIGAIFPLISLVFLVLAYRGIRKDEKMVRSADRLRG